MGIESLVLAYIANGLLLGSLYALMAAGLTVIFSVMKIVNFAQGEFFMIGGYAYYMILSAANVPAPIGIISAFAAGALIGLIFERFLLKPMYGMRAESWDEYAIIMTFGLSILLQNIALLMFGAYYYSPPAILPGVSLTLGILKISGDRVLASLIAYAFLGLVYAFFRYTWLGTALKAVSQSRDAASTLGINPQRMYQFSIMIGGALSAGAGALLSYIFLVYPNVGTMPLIKGFAIIVLGGMGSIVGSTLGGLILGIIESLGTGFISISYRDAYAFIILILILLLKPSGILGERARRV